MLKLRHIAVVVLAVAGPLAAAATSAASQPACDAAGIAAAALAPQGGLPTNWIGELSPYMLFFQVLADFSYEKDISTRIKRKSVGPCLEAWGIKEWERFDTTTPLGADLHFLLMRTDDDLILSIRGMDSRGDVTGQDTLTSPTFDPEVFGAEKFAAAYNNTLPDGKPNPEAFWTLEGYTASFETVRTRAGAVIDAWLKKMNPTAKMWFVGHSDGSQLAQLGALRYAHVSSPGAVGGVLLFGPSRVGSRGFAKYYNTVLGAKTVYYSYGRDPALAYSYPMSEGLAMPGMGLRACPVKGQATERLVHVPLGGDQMAPCAELPLVSTPLSRVWLPDWVFGTSDPSFTHLVSWEYLAHHIPAVTYDGLMRLLQAGPEKSKPSACALAALRLNQCVVSFTCSVALRPAGARGCRGCASDDTCRDYWAAPGARCDRGLAELSGWMCYDGKLPGTLLNLLWGKNGAPIDHTQSIEIQFANPFKALQSMLNGTRARRPAGGRK